MPLNLPGSFPADNEPGDPSEMEHFSVSAPSPIGSKQKSLTGLSINTDFREDFADSIRLIESAHFNANGLSAPSKAIRQTP